MNVRRYCVYGSATTRQNICNGDSGGPCSKNGLLYGVASGGPTGCPKNNPYGDFVRVFSVCDWINSVLSSELTTEPPVVTSPDVTSVTYVNTTHLTTVTDVTTVPDVTTVTTSVTTVTASDDSSDDSSDDISDDVSATVSPCGKCNYFICKQ